MASRRTLAVLPPSWNAARRATVLLGPGGGLARCTTTMTTTTRAYGLVTRRSATPTPILQQHRPLVAPTPVSSTTTTTSSRRNYSQQEQEQQQQSNKIWSFEDVQKLIQEPEPGVVIVDVREPGELKSTGRIPRAVNIPITSAPDSFHIRGEEFEDRFGYPRPGKGAEVVFYCKAGVRSRAAAGLAREAGWTNVGEYPGSWMDWAAKGGKVEKE